MARRVLCCVLIAVIGFQIAPTYSIELSEHGHIILRTLKAPAEDPPPQNDPIQLLSQHLECREDVKRICGLGIANVSDNTLNNERMINNFQVLECLMSNVYADIAPPSKECQHVVYGYKMKITQDGRFEAAAKDVCKEFIQELTHEGHQACPDSPTGAFLSCLMEASYDLKKKDSDTPCHNFLTKMETIVFSDYHLVYGFQDACSADIQKFHCGRLPGAQNPEDMAPHHQGEVMDCLMQNSSDLADACHRAVLRVAELQADDYHLDRPLFFACRHDREVLCQTISSGDGKVYECLMENKENPKMSLECRNQIAKRQKLTQEDLKVNKGLFMACKETFVTYGCFNVNEDGPRHTIYQASDAMHCLLSKAAQGTEEVRIPDECHRHMGHFQQSLMEDFQITPGIVAKCKAEIQAHCPGFQDVKAGGETIHCLMSLARKKAEGNFKGELGVQCESELSSLVEEANPADNIQVDGYLYRKCSQHLQERCKGREDAIDCLMQQIESGFIDPTEECGKHVLELEYFLSRNYRLDKKLIRHCKEYMLKEKLIHHDPKVGPSDEAAFARLWQIVRHQDYEDENNIQDKVEHPKVPAQCAKEVRRIVRERAVDINLEPEMEADCLHDLSTLCRDARPGEEIKCLEDHYEKLSENCKKQMEEFIPDQDRDSQLDYILMKSCEPVLRTYCQHTLDAVQEGEADEGHVIGCLIEHKFDNKMDQKCFAGISHHQLVSMKDFNFNTQFRAACKDDFHKLCNTKHSKADVIYCLSDHVRNDTLLDAEHRVSEKCRDQLHVELLAFADAADLDPKFKAACSKEFETVCRNAEKNKEGLMDCLRNADPRQISPECHRYTFKVEQMENAVAGAGAGFFRQCQAEIKNFCPKVHPADVLGCLDSRYSELSAQCKKALNVEQEHQNSDIRLNPALYKPCRADIEKFCHKEISSVKENEELEGKVINCLKKEYIKGEKSKLSETCSNQMMLLVRRVHERDYKQDYLLTAHCTKEIQECSKESSAEDHIIECLKKKLFDGQLKNDAICQAEVFRLITESRVDIHTDKELYSACASYVSTSVCGTLPTGRGRVMSCLLDQYTSGKLVHGQCAQMVKVRKDLWEQAAKMEPPKDFQELFSDITESSSKWYFLSVLGVVVLSILIVGVFCGRATKRLSAQLKNR